MLRTLLVLSFSGFACSQSAAAQTFSDPASIASSLFSPRSLVAADIDGDSDDDLLIAGQTVAWRENLGDNQFGPVRSISDPLEFQVPFDAKAADLDGDGDLDVVASGRFFQVPSFQGGIFWFENLGAGSFGPGVLIADGGDDCEFVDLADLDADGDIDIVAELVGIRCYFNDGAGQFSFASNVVTSGQLKQSVFTVDYDDDGLPDIVTAGNTINSSFGTTTDGNASVYRNLGGGSFSLPIVLYSKTNQPVDSCGAGDIDGDGDVDFFVSSVSGLYMIENLGGGVIDTSIFGAPGGPIDPSGAGAFEMAFADGDGDGLLDLFTADGFADTASWRRNLGGPEFDLAPAIPLTSDAEYAVDILASDLNGDGHPEVYVASLTNDDVTLIPNLGGGVFGEEVELFSEPIELAAATSADMDGDSDPDLLFCDASADLIGLFENLGDGSFGAREVIATQIANPTDLTASDLDGDGDLDLLVSLLAGVAIWIENLGSGQLGAPQPLASGLTTSTFCLSSDLDADGTPEVVVGAAGGIAVVANLGAGLFGPTQFLSAPISIADRGRAADVDGDGDLDLLVSAGMEGTLGWFENLSAASFAPYQDLIVGLPSIDSFGAADLDGDGDVDLIYASDADKQVAWHPNQGDATFGPKLVLEQADSSLLACETGDLDGDGDPEILMGASAFGFLSWKENLGQGLFGPTQVLDDSTANITSILAGDWTGNGAVDLVAGSVTDGIFYTLNLAPTPLALSPDSIAWYDGSSFTLSGTQFVPGVPAEVVIDGELILTADVAAEGLATFDLPADQLPESGPLNVTLQQGELKGTLAGGLTILPALDAQVAGSAVAGGAVTVNIQASNPGVAYLLISSSTTSSPFALTEVHGILHLDLAGLSILTTAPIPSAPTAVIPFPAGLLSPGTQTSIQGLVGEITPAGTLAGFTQALTLSIQ